ncbi:flocculation protein FLO11 [Hyalella azteca]|uniref:Flocculation protein FLO11 n=1 Tax=Hyalella azteca TaxID=294128 RepID=A0A8B7NCA4_HYAAZ|nr:flocculation protein FLO11 [Hyalella azteca]
MTISKDIRNLLEDVHHFLADVLPSHHLPEPAELQRTQLLDQLLDVATRYPLVSLNITTAPAAAAADAAKVEGLEPKGLALVDSGKKVLKRSGSVSSHSSGGSYTSTSFTSNDYTSASYTSNGYGSYEATANSGQVDVLHEDIYEEFDTVHARMPANSCGAGLDSLTPSANAAATTTSANSSNLFFSAIRSSLSYGKKKDKTGLQSQTNNDHSTEKKSKQINRTSLNDSNSEDTTGSKENNRNHRKTSSNVEQSILAGERSSIESSSSNLEDNNEYRPENGLCQSNFYEEPEAEEVASLVNNVSAEAETLEAENNYAQGLQPIAFSSNLACCSRHGVLRKKTKRRLRPWRQFQCVVANGKLFLYNKETDHRQLKCVELGLYDVRVATGEETSPQSARDPPCLELVAPGSKTHTFMARSVADRDAWIQAVGQYTKNSNSLPAPSTRHSNAVSTADLDTSNPPSNSSSRTEDDSPVNNKGGSDTEKKKEKLRKLSDFIPKPLLSRGSSSTSLGTNNSPSPNVTTNSKQDPLSGSSDLLTAEEGSGEDCFYSEELYEEMNLDELRCRSGPSLSEMLEPHLFPNCDTSSAYYCVPNDMRGEDVTSCTSDEEKISNAEPQPCVASPKTPRKTAPVRPPPPNISLGKLEANRSALHDEILSPKNPVLNALACSTSNKKAAVKSPGSQLSKIFPACRSLPFSSPSRPLPATPQKDMEESGFYCEISDDDFYEESEADGTSFATTSITVTGSLPNRQPVLNPRPPLPVRGPPPIPTLPHSSSVRAPIPASSGTDVATNSQLLEEYDIPDDVRIHTAVENQQQTSSSSSIGNSSSDSDSVAPEVDNVYKIPNATVPVSEDIYKVPPSIPIPVGNNNLTLTNKSDINNKVEANNSDGNSLSTLGGVTSEVKNVDPLEPVPPVSSSVYQSPAPVSVPVDKFLCRALGTGNKKSGENEDLKSKCSADATKMKTVNTNTSVGRSLNSSEKKPEMNVSIKDRIALFNQNKALETTQLSINKTINQYSDELLVRLDDKEIRLDNAKKKAFLQSTLNFSNYSPSKGQTSRES